MGGVFDNIASSAKGMITDGAGEKAILYIYLANLPELKKLKTKKENEDYLGQEANSLNKLASELLKSTKSRISASGMWDDLKGAVKSGTNSSENIAEIYNSTQGGSFIKFKVQYNPATIRLSSVNGKIQSRKGEEGIDKVSVYNFSGKSKLSFDLIFDDCDNLNAFGLNDVANINITSGLNKAYDAYKHGGNTYSVRKRMDAIMSLLSSAATQQVVFFWAKMCFRGTITDVGNKFTMFNPQGNPIRGEMHLELTQDKASKHLNYDDKYWENAFNTCFKPKDGLAGAAGGSSTANAFLNNNIINLSL